MVVGEVFLLGGPGGASHHTGPTALTQQLVNLDDTLLLVKLSSIIGTDGYADLAPAAQILIDHSHDGLMLELLLGEQADNLGGGSAGLGDGFGNISGTLSGSGQVESRDDALHGAKFGMGFAKEAVLIGGQL